MGLDPITQSAIILAASSLGGSLLGSKHSTVTQNSTSTTPNTMDPLYKVLSPYMMGQAINSAKNFSGWGGGNLFGWNPTSMGGVNINDEILKMLAGALPGLINSTGAKTATGFGSGERLRGMGKTNG